MNEREFPTYEGIGVRLPQLKGNYTIISGSVVLPQVRQAMYEASQRYVHLEELMEAVGARIAELMECEWGLVTNGCGGRRARLRPPAWPGPIPKKWPDCPIRGE